MPDTIQRMLDSTSNGDAGSGERVPAVSGYNRTGVEVDLDHWVNVARTTLTGEAILGGQLDLIFVDAEEMAELNATHMGQSGPTDVLSFPLDGFPELEPEFLDDLSGEETPPLHLGDVVICVEVAERQAPEHCGSLEAELSLLVIHGVLHILGHDHGEANEALAMQARERHYLDALGMTHPVPA